MKKLIPVVLVACLVLGLVWYKQHLESPASSPAPEPQAETAPPPTPAPQPLATPVIAAPTPAKRLAPEGTFYVIQTITITDDSGITGINPGTKVTLVEDKGTSKIVSDGKNKFEVTANQITTDLDVVDQIKQAQAAAQLQAAQVAAAAAAAPTDSVMTPDSGAPPPPPMTGAGAPPVNAQALYEKQHKLQVQIDTLTQQKAYAENQIAAIHNAIQKQEDRDTRLGYVQIGRFDIPKGYRDIKTLEAQRDALAGQITQLQAQLGAIQ